jgi:NAD(P)-dependent dehydrogenase (short-subunit alcohol dehydrogenase family)
MKPSDGIVWITGASSGIGAAVALEMANRGWQVAISARSRDKLDKIAELHSNITAISCDVTDRDGMSKTAQKIEAEIGSLAMIIANAGIYLPTHFPKFDVSIFDDSFAVNLTGTVNMIAASYPYMIERNKGQIVLVSSVAGYNGLPTSAAYGATKAALLNMGEAMAVDLAKYGLSVNMVAPGFIDTPATQQNTFHMPALMDVTKAAKVMVDGLEKNRTRITFPKRFTFWLRFLTFLPRQLYVRLLSR